MSEPESKRPETTPSSPSGAAQKPPRNQFLMGIIVAVGLAVIVAIVASRSGPGEQAAATEVWYFDLGSNQLFSHLEAIPPIDAPSGPYQGGKGGVLAAVYSCGDCKDESKRFVAWMITCKPGSRADVERRIVPPVISAVGARTQYLLDQMPEAWQIKSPDYKKWIDLESPEADQFRRIVTSQCAHGKPATPCTGPASP